MQEAQAKHLLEQALREIVNGQGNGVRTDEFYGLREVDAKVREVRMILEAVDSLPPNFLNGMTNDIDFTANSRRIRLEALANYIKTALKFLDTGGAFAKPKKVIHSPPDFSRLTLVIPGLEDELARRWREAQKCIHVEAYTPAIILMGSILEGLLLARVQLDLATACRSSRAPKDKEGRHQAAQNWSLSALIEVASDVGWIKTDRAKFGHALRESRNVVHPWQAVATRINFDAATCITSWSVLDASVADLLASLP